jgi:hypothetical protein
MSVHYTDFILSGWVSECCGGEVAGDIPEDCRCLECGDHCEAVREDEEDDE